MKLLLFLSVLSISITNRLNSKTTTIKENQYSFFENLKEGDYLIINYQSSGCFHQHSETLEFEYKNGKLIGHLKTDDNKKTAEIKLSEIKYLIDFEYQLIKINAASTGCTTVNSFTFKLNNEKSINRKDDTCSWNGYKELKEKYFK